MRTPKPWEIKLTEEQQERADRARKFLADLVKDKNAGYAAMVHVAGVLTAHLKEMKKDGDSEESVDSFQNLMAAIMTILGKGQEDRYEPETIMVDVLLLLKISEGVENVFTKS